MVVNVVNSKISESEMKVMEMLWAKGKMVTISDLLLMLSKEEGVWIYQNVATFLKRLEVKGFVSKVKNGKAVYYYPLISREQYNNSIARNFVNIRFGGSIKRFLSAFSESDKISTEEIQELKEWVDYLDRK